MTNLTSFSARLCYTAAGCLIQDDKVLLVKHKKLGIWLNPGGHIEEHELAHQAAEREFWEETGVTVRAVPYNQLPNTKDNEFTPSPFATNLHWISKDNYDARLEAEKDTAREDDDYGLQKGWERGCEQHYNFLYLVEPVDGVDFKQNVEETDGIAWFTKEELPELETRDNIRAEIGRAFELYEELQTTRK
jgi:8-oxo-dGTP pyrophosphatase MutT (NUDIX family)